MPKVQFIGKVLPAPAMLAVTLPDLTWKWEEQNLNLAFRVRINNSFVNIECELEKYEPAYAAELHKRALDLARAAVNVVGFATGLGLSVYLEALIAPDGIPAAILLKHPATTPLCTAYSLELARAGDLAAVYNLVLTEPPLFRALNDLIESVALPHVSAVNCGRVIDSIRRMITPDPNAAAKNAWQAMHEALNISREYQEWVSNQARGPRHGDPAYVPADVTHEIMHRSWAIMNRYLEYRRRGRTPLTAPEFPLLPPQS
jgi:hypothetical protein